jgi:RimJ/RimL family protein N-acetyltransferase
MYAQMEPPLFNLGKEFTIKSSPVYLQYSDNVPFRPDSRDLEPIMRKGFKIFTHSTDRPTTEVGYLIVQGHHDHPLFREPTIDLSWLFINETERSKHYGSYAVRIFEGVFKHHPGKFADAKILSARTNEDNTAMCHILEKNGWIQAEDRTQPNMVDFKKARPKI